MIAVVQRVASASVDVVAADGSRERTGEIERGVCVLLGVVNGDGEEQAAWMARKLVALRIHADEDDRMNRSLADVGGAMLLVSQFTLAGSCRKGNRPSFVDAAPPELAEPLCARVATLVAEAGVRVETGRFRTDMRVSIVNDGPVTVIIDSSE